MKKKLIIVSIILLPIVAFIFHILFSTGFFKTIDHKMNGKIFATVPIAGVEDLSVDEDDNFAIFISYDRAAERDGKPHQNAIHIMDFNPILLP
ncbi:MAG: hypothetical protein HC803_07250 [Saprospiraceae bacterium]|nr:hypothetical protein [Saprospiraceae bacterium]